VIQNCHLAPQWIHKVEQLMQMLAINPRKIDPQNGLVSFRVAKSFRLWLTTELRGYMPSKLLDSCVR
jgi:hypothetical protein